MKPKALANRISKYLKEHFSDVQVKHFETDVPGRYSVLVDHDGQRVGELVCGPEDNEVWARRDRTGELRRLLGIR
jgi:hypothetical protein